MGLSEEVEKLDSIFIDTAPIIYHIEAHPLFGLLMRKIVDILETKNIGAFSSVVTITEVLPKPVKAGRRDLVEKFVSFLRYSGSLELIDISANVAEKAGELRGRYEFLKTLDALQLSAALEGGAEAFLTNARKLKQIQELKIICLKDYV